MVIGREVERFTHRGEQWTRSWAEPYEAWVVGVDPRGSMDYTAICALRHERVPVPGEWNVSKPDLAIRQKVKETFTVFGLRRLPLGLPHPQQVDSGMVLENLAFQSSKLSRPLTPR
jgi:hypothetical protein